MRPREAPHLSLPSPRRSAWGLVGSLLAHALVVAAVLAAGRSAYRAAAGEGMLGLGGGGGGGGGGGREVALPALAQAPAPPATEVADVVEQPVPEPVPVVEPEDDPTAVALLTPPDSLALPAGGPGSGPGQGPGSGGGSGGGTGGGIGTGTGTGSGPGSGTGGGGGDLSRPPRMRHLVILPEGAPPTLRGRTVRVTFFVAASGAVDRLEVTPPLEDSDYAARFEERLRSYRFRPALDAEGRPVPGRFPITLDLPSR